MNVERERNNILQNLIVELIKKEIRPALSQETNNNNQLAIDKTIFNFKII